MQTTECARNIWCNCGVAVSAGRDVFIVNNCGNGGRKKWDVRFRECKDRVLRRKVTRVTTSHYKVSISDAYLNKTVLCIFALGRVKFRIF